MLFNKTIRENLLYGNPAATQADIDEALKASNAYNFIQKLPDGVDTNVGNAGGQLSGG